MAIQKYTSNNQENVGFPKGKWMVTEDDHLTALREQRVGIGKMVFEMLYKERIDCDRLQEIRDAILAYGGEEEKDG